MEGDSILARADVDSAPGASTTLRFELSEPAEIRPHGRLRRTGYGPGIDTHLEFDLYRRDELVGSFRRLPRTEIPNRTGRPAIARSRPYLRFETWAVRVREPGAYRLVVSVPEGSGRKRYDRLHLILERTIHELYFHALHLLVVVALVLSLVTREGSSGNLGHRGRLRYLYHLAFLVLVALTLGTSRL